MTVFDFARKCMNDEEFNRGGIVKNERKWLDAVGFRYTVEGGQIVDSDDDVSEFYKAMYTLLMLNNKYKGVNK